MSVVLVTGAAGFIGSHTVDALLANGHRVVGIDNFRTGRRENLVAALGHGNFVFHESDILAPGLLAQLTQRYAPNVIIHLAALVSVPESFRDPGLNFRLNLKATHMVIDAARIHAVRRIVFASSAAVYGDVDALPLRENGPVRPLSPYGAAKLASEQLLLGCGLAFGFVARCQRYFNVYGPRQDPSSPYSGVISIFSERAQAGLPVHIHGDGEQTRDFIFVRDVAWANVLAATSPALQSGVVNVCTGKATSLKTTGALIAEHFPAIPAARHEPARGGDIRHSRGDSRLAAEELGFTATTRFPDGLAELLDTMSARPNAVTRENK